MHAAMYSNKGNTTVKLITFLVW